MENLQLDKSDMPQVEIFENGKRVDTSAIDNYDDFMMFLVAASTAASTRKLVKIAEDDTSQGWIQPFNNIPVTSTEPSLEIHANSPGQSVSLRNAGPGQVNVYINHRNMAPKLLNALQLLNIDFKGHKLTNIYISCPVAGATAVVDGLIKG